MTKDIRKRTIEWLRLIAIGKLYEKSHFHHDNPNLYLEDVIEILNDTVEKITELPNLSEI